MKTRVRIDERTGLGYFSKALRDEGFRGDVVALGNSRVLALIIPGTRLADVKRCLEALLTDLDIRLVYEDTTDQERESCSAAAPIT